MSDPEMTPAEQVDYIEANGDPRGSKTTGLDANPDDHDDGDDFEDQGGELEFEDEPFDEDEDPEDNEGKDMPDDFQLED